MINMDATAAVMALAHSPLSIFLMRSDLRE